MFENYTGATKTILSILLFPIYFQQLFLTFAWGSSDEWTLVLAKRIFILLPVLAFILACWLTIACLMSVIVRQNRREFLNALLLTWWDLGKAIAHFWAGIFGFVFNLAAGIIGAVKIILLGAWTFIQDIFLLPFRVLRNSGSNLMRSRIPWLAIIMTLAWCLVETTIFTYVMTPLVLDTFSNITGEQLSELGTRIPLFMFLFVVVLGSYAVLANFMDAVERRDVGSILGIGAVEIIVLLVEVMFLYREFVDALVPWLAQYSENFDLGIGGIIGISTFVWFGIRSLSWFLFAAHGTPTILSIIQGRGIEAKPDQETQSTEAPETDSGSDYYEISRQFIKHIKEDIDWFQQKGEAIVAAFVLPPLQVVAAAVNFCALFVSGGHLFQIPFRKLTDITESGILMKQIPKKAEVYHDA